MTVNGIKAENTEMRQEVVRLDAALAIEVRRSANLASEKADARVQYSKLRDVCRAQEEVIICLTAEVERLRAALKLDKPRAAWADAIQKNGRLCEEIERLRAVVDVADKLQNGICDATSLTAENKKLQAALLVARKYVLVQSCELSLQPDDAARDLDVIDEALEEDDD